MPRGRPPGSKNKKTLAAEEIPPTATGRAWPRFDRNALDPLQIDRERVEGDKEYRDELRFRCITDHAFLAPLLRFDKFLPAIHQPAIDLYVKKSPGLPLEKQHRIKYRLHLDPRGTFKTTLGIVDTVQWILADPDVTILNETATQPLARALTTVTAHKFCKPKMKDATTFQLLFPEHVIDKVTDGEFNSPARTFEQVERTIMSTSVQSSGSGWHPMILNPDDPVDTENSGIHASAEMRRRVIDTHYTNRNRLRDGGYMHMRGTRYHPFDLWGDTLEKMDPAEWKILVRAAMTVGNGQRLRPGEFPERADVELCFPGLLTYELLRSKFREDYETFMCQQMNDPSGGNVPTFTPEIYGQVQVEPERIPYLGESFACWRLPYGGKDFMMRYAEGVACRIFQGRCYVIDAWQGSYTPTGLAEKIVKESIAHQASRVMIEDSPGARFIEAGIRNEAVKRNASLRVDWLEFEEDDTQRRERMRQLEPTMNAGRLQISTAVGKAQELKRQFVHFGLVSENGLVDTISRIALKLPATTLRAEIADEEVEAWRRRREQAMHEMVFGAAGQAAMEEQARRAGAEAEAQASRNVNSYGLPDMLGFLDG